MAYIPRSPSFNIWVQLHKNRTWSEVVDADFQNIVSKGDGKERSLWNYCFASDY